MDASCSAQPRRDRCVSTRPKAGRRLDEGTDADIATAVQQRLGNLSGLHRQLVERRVRLVTGGEPLRTIVTDTGAFYALCGPSRRTPVIAGNREIAFARRSATKNSSPR